MDSTKLLNGIFGKLKLERERRNSWNPVNQLPTLLPYEKKLISQSDPVLGSFKDGTMGVVVCVQFESGKIEWILDRMPFLEMTKVIEYWRELPFSPVNK